MENNQADIYIEMASWEHLQHINSRVAKSANHFIKRKESQSNTLQKTLESSQYDFYIEDNKVQIIENTSYTTYTFFVIRDSLTPNILENYVYKDNDDGTYEQYLLKYHYTTNENDEIIYNTDILEIETIFDDNLLFNKSDCSPEFVQVFNGMTSTYNTRCTGSGHEIGDDRCTCQNTPETCYRAGSTTIQPSYTYEFQGCGGGTGSDNNPNDNTNDGGGQGTTNTIPLEDTRPAWQPIINCINTPTLIGHPNTDSSTIDNDIFEQLNLTSSQINSIIDFLENNDCTETAQEEVIEDLINMYDEYQIINKLNGKALCVYNKLKSSSTGFKNSIKKFDGEFTIADIKFELDNTGETVAVYDNSGNIVSYDRAYTSFPDVNNLITISINNVPNSNNNVDTQPNLLLAQTIAHEVIHAEMFRQILDAVENGSIIGLTNQDVLDALESSEYTELYEYFRQYQNWSHTYMAEHFRDVIARMTQEFDTGISVPDSEQPEQLYLDLAWRGLMNNIAWDNEGQNQTAIENTINNYVTNNSNEICISKFNK